MNIQSLPAINAFLNATSAVLLMAGFVCIRRKRIAAHRAFMVTAMTTSALFLVSYLVYHYYTGSRRFTGTGGLRTAYLLILSSHTILATVIVPMALVTVTRAFRKDFARHRSLARWTFPLWMYVSVTGVVVYWMLYQM
jgi:putative membrane protein